MPKGERVPFRPTRRAVIFLLASLALTALIATGLSRVTFEPGMPLPSFTSGEVSVAAPGRAPVGMPMGRLAGTIVLIVLGVSVVALIIRALWGVPGKRLLAGFWSLLWKLALAAGVLLAIASLLPRSLRADSAPPQPSARPLVTAPLGAVPPALLWAAGIGMGTVVLLLVIRMTTRRPVDCRPWEQEMVIARQALLDGHDLRGVIVRCYSRMAEALQEERGIERESFMTAGEFEALLGAKGLPPEPVRALTRLFEAARYSLWQPATGEEQAAIRCLDSILEYARRLPPATPDRPLSSGAAGAGGPA
jgi:hypothetical protein